ncbi:Probable lipoprotein [Caballeronia glathei]|jgi:hypothetical protein|nr:hypothetical protein B0G84_7073 [Paraburkholderia sp. BL8N3]CDY74957.1 Probable lipoprotein [Caballeronia glathei]
MYASGTTNDARSLRFLDTEKSMKRLMSVLLVSASVLSGCAVYVPDAPVVVGKPQGGPGNGFCPPGQAKKGNC